ncbi:MAG: hypothetical protein B5M48_02500 [Candidatus Omnitrophica bacterium 4484_213]|nr:hypothetical protein [Candidatus Omnitrophota bacterium]OQX53792.1 MAG: hypothetical protein B5M48_02500 [Candidatus Omnitrophica bacterium 4484_213]
MKNIWAIIAGVIATILGIIALVKWAPAIWIILQGIIVAGLIIGGIITVVVGVSNIKDKLAEKKEKKE